MFVGKGTFADIIAILRTETTDMERPALDRIVAEYGRDPFLILISCLLSLRTKDTTSVPVSRALFARARKPCDMVAFDRHELERILHPLGFYRKKADIVQSVSREIIERFEGRVPATRDELLSIKGIGQKTAHAVLGWAFGIPALCVDTHVHRLANRLGLAETRTPEQTEQALTRAIEPRYWIETNRLFVMWGQNVCTPVLPWCSRCAIAHLCPKRGVKRSR